MLLLEISFGGLLLNPGGVLKTDAGPYLEPLAPEYFSTRRDIGIVLSELYKVYTLGIFADARAWPLSYRSLIIHPQNETVDKP